jgi:hypothetical protein
MGISVVERYVGNFYTSYVTSEIDVSLNYQILKLGIPIIAVPDTF